MKSTKKALFTSIMSLLLCVSMLVGTTFAWFTDSVTSGTNQIVAGNLDVELEHQDKNQTAFSTVSTTTKLFDDVDPNLWEPGAVAYENLKVSNKGNLALQYRLNLHVTNETKVVKNDAERGLSQVLKVAVVPGGVDTTNTRSEVIAAGSANGWSNLASFTKNGTLSAKAASDETNPSETYGVVIYWEPTDHDNDFNMNNGITDQLKLDLGVTLVATQYTSEIDSFDQYYDVLTDPVDVYTVEEFNEALATASTNAVINVMTPDLNLSVAYDDAKTITLKGEKIAELTADIPNGTIHVYNEVTTVHGTNVDLQHSAHFHNKVTTLNATAGHFVIEPTATVEAIQAMPSSAKELKIEIRGTATTLTTPAQAPEKDLEIQVVGSIGEVVVPTASTKIAVVVEENANVNSLNITDTAENAKIVLQNSGTIGNAAAIENKTQEMESIDQSAKTLAIKNAAELKAFANDINGAGKYRNYTVTLESDIDLNNSAWTPIGNVTSYPGVTFCGTFDGQGHTIKNLNATDTTVSYAAAGLFGSVCGTIKNLTVENVTIVSSHYAGGIVGYSSANASVIENCHVKGGTITSVPELIGNEYDNGDKVGGIIGYAVSGDQVTNCSVENVTITAHRDLGGIAGCVQTGDVVTGCSVKNTTINQSNKNGYKTGVTTVDAVVGRLTVGGTVTGNTVENVKVNFAPVSVKNQADLNAAVAAAATGASISIDAAGTYTVPGISKNITIKGGVDNVVFNCVGSGSIASIPNGATFESVKFLMGTADYHGFQHAGLITMKDCEIDGKFFSYSDMVFDGCTFNQTASDYSMWAYAGNITYTDCTINCNGKFVNVYNEGNGAWKITAENCTFNSTKMNKAAFNVKASCGAKGLSYDVTINNCTANGDNWPAANNMLSNPLVLDALVQVDDIKESVTPASNILITLNGEVVFSMGNEF